MVEPVGVEPTSENSFTAASPSAVSYLIFINKTPIDRIFIYYRHKLPASVMATHRASFPIKWRLL